MFCPRCRSEFVEGVTQCATCEVELVETVPDEDALASPEAMARALAGKELEAVLVGHHVALQEAQRGLADAGILSAIAGEPDGEVEPGMHARFFLMVETDQIENVRQFVRQQWEKGLEVEGLMLTGELPENDGTCPACGTALPENEGECPECGLFLGNPAESE